MKSWRRWIVRAVLLLAGIMCVYIGVTVWAVRGDLHRALTQLPVSVLPSMVGIVLVGIGLRAVRWQYYVRRLKWDVPLHHSLLAFVASFAFTATPGKAGELVKSVLLRERHNVPVADGVGVLLVERLGDLLAVIVLAAGGLAMLADAWIYFVGAALFVAAITVFVSSRRIYEPVLTRLAKLPVLSRVALKVLGPLRTGEALLRPGPFLVGVGIAVLAWGCEGWAMHILLRSLDIPTDFLRSCAIFGIATLVGALSAMPGGLGGFEVIMVLLLSRQGLSVAAATLPVVVFRFCTLWLSSVLGLVCMLGWLSFVSKPDRVEISEQSP